MLYPVATGPVGSQGMSSNEGGFAMTTESAAAAAALQRGIDNFLRWRADVVPNIHAAVEADPGFGFAHAVFGLMLHGARNVHMAGKIAGALAAAEAAADGMSRRERLYLDALALASRGEIAHSVAVYEAILATDPTDLLAQRLAQMELFWLGEMRWSAEISGRVANHWTEDVPLYGIYLSCRAFDLEETHHYKEAERLGRQAVARDATDVWGTHAVAHVLLMQGRFQEGIDWLDGLKDHWAEANQMMFHLWWHRCLFHLERGEHDEVLAIHDTWVRNRDLPLTQAMPDLYIDMQNGASLLLRLELRGVDVGGRWDELAALALNRLEDHTSPFTSAHYAAILAAAGHFEAADQLVQSMRDFAATDTGTLGPRYAAAGIAAAEAAIAHRKGDHGAVIAALLPVRRMLWQIGGSDAQRDLFFLLLADSARREGRQDVADLVLIDAAAAGFDNPAGRAGYRAA